jgi:curli biogenesis system outer membrane secretion channel CsgG
VAVCFVVPAIAQAQATSIKKPVVSIDDIQDMAGTGQAPVLREMIETAVVNTGKFRIMERGDQGTAILLDEQNRAKAGLVTSNTPGKIGGFEGVDFKVYGAITAGGASNRRNVGASTAMQVGGRLMGGFGALGNAMGGAMIANSNCNDSSAGLAIDIRITDGSTGELKYAKHITQTQQGGTTCGATSQVDINGLMRSASERISMGLVTIMYPVKVVDVDDDGSVMLNYGEGLLEPGDVFALMQQGKEIVDPDTGAVLGHKESYLGLVQISDVEPKMSKAKMVSNFAAPPPVGTVAREATPEELAQMGKRR